MLLNANRNSTMFRKYSPRLIEIENRLRSSPEVLSPSKKDHRGPRVRIRNLIIVDPLMGYKPVVGRMEHPEADDIKK